MTDLLDSLGIDALEVNMETVDDKDGVKRILDEKSGNSMVPKIFIRGKYIGMLSQLKQLEESGELIKMVEDTPGDKMDE